MRIVSFNAQTSKFPMVVIVKLLDYEDELSLVKAKLECDCGHVFTITVLEPGDTVECPKARVEYKFEPLKGDP